MCDWITELKDPLGTLSITALRNCAVLNNTIR
jgi:hypothetical protein